MASLNPAHGKYSSFLISSTHYTAFLYLGQLIATDIVEITCIHYLSNYNI